MKRTDVRSHCPINFSLEAFGDSWSLLIIRDMVCYGKKTYGEFLSSKERMSTRTLAMRLEHLEKEGLLAKKPNPTDKRKELYYLTPKGLALVPILIELATWGAEFDPLTSSPKEWIEAVRADKKANKQNLSPKSKRALFFAGSESSKISN